MPGNGTAKGADPYRPGSKLHLSGKCTSPDLGWGTPC